MQGLCKELFHPAKFCLHCSYAYEAKTAFLLENGKHESGAWVALQPVSFSQQLAKVSSEGASLRHVAITLSFRRASLSKLRLTIFELFFACILPTKYKNQNVSTKPPPNLLWLAAVKRRPAVMQPTLQTRVCRFQEEKQS